MRPREISPGQWKRAYKSTKEEYPDSDEELRRLTYAYNAPNIEREDEDGSPETDREDDYSETDREDDEGRTSR